MKNKYIGMEQYERSNFKRNTMGQPKIKLPDDFENIIDKLLNEEE